MDIVLASLAAAAVAAGVVTLLLRARVGAVALESARPAGSDGEGAPAPASRGSGRAERSVGDDAASELQARRGELARLEERVRAREAALEEKERAQAEQARTLDRDRTALADARGEQLRALERAANLSPGQARQVLLGELEDEVRHDSARIIRHAEDGARQEADRRARSIVTACMQRVAGGHTVETTVSTVELRSDELKGRIIGKEGRNIRTLETLTGIDFIIDDTPGAVLLSGFDGVRREVARMTLQRLLHDGRIHPARIEEAFTEASGELDARIVELGEQAAFDVGVGSLAPELVTILGRLHFRTSYGQNVLSHSVECARLAGLLAAELGANPKTATRAALLHDMGKAVSHEIEGPHALVGGRLARRHHESEAVAHALETHHNEIEPQTIEAVIVQVADSISGARPGARGQTLERYVTRLQDLEAVAARHRGVEKVYAIHAGREIRVVVKPEEIDDDAAALLSRAIARAVESELDYPGQIKITVIRESRATNYAR